MRDAASREMYRPVETESNLIVDTKSSELSYRNSSCFVTLYPDTPNTTERPVKTLILSTEPGCMLLRPDREYEISPFLSGVSIQTWWDYGRKWQLLKWYDWLPGTPVLASTHWTGDEGQNRPGPFEVCYMNACRFRVTE